jgi:hypothetical protein
MCTPADAFSLRRFSCPFVCADCDFACLLYEMLTHKLPLDTLLTIIRDAVAIEQEFICESIPCALLGMNKEMMMTYIEFVADRLLQTLGVNKFYNAVNPFDWMESDSPRVCSACLDLLLHCSHLPQGLCERCACVQNVVACVATAASLDRGTSVDLR